ncbi:MAG: DUF4142 domain-containing protein [Bacteroidota bacterium]
MKKFKTYLKNTIPLFVIILLIISGCQSKSYYSANNKNLQRFGGYQLETANHLVKVYDLEMLIVDLAELAEAQAVSRDIYLAAKDVQERFDKMKLETKMEAAIQRTTLSSTLSAESDKYYHRLTNTPRDDFDTSFKNMILSKFEELKSIIEDYDQKGQSDRVKEMGDAKVLNINKHIKQFQGNGVS